MNEEIIKEAARKLNIPEDTVSEVYGCYFEKMRKCIEEVNLFVRFEPGEFEKQKLKFQLYNMGYLCMPKDRMFKINKHKLWKLLNTK